MILQLIQIICALLLFIFSFIFVYFFLKDTIGRYQLKSELKRTKRHVKPFHATKRKTKRSYTGKWIQSLQVMLDLSRMRIPVTYFLWMLIVMFLIGMLFGAWMFQSVRGTLLCAVMFGILPYLIGKLRQISVQTRSRIEFLPAVEIYYQYYVLSESGNVRSVLRAALAGDRITYPIRPIFERLEIMLSMHNPEEAFERFSMSLGHVWADYFAAILKIAVQEGTNITMSLRELIHDMRAAQRSAQVDKNRLLEIRIANFTPLGFLAVFIAVNFKLQPEQAFYYYFIDPNGKALLLNALALIFASMLMGIYLSMKKM